jgi:hypothetical protein
LLLVPELDHLPRFREGVAELPREYAVLRCTGEPNTPLLLGQGPLLCQLEQCYPFTKEDIALFFRFQFRKYVGQNVFVAINSSEFIIQKRRGKLSEEL